MLKLVFIQNSIDYGGVEKALISLTNFLAGKYDVEIVVIDKTKSRLINDVNPNVTLTFCDGKIRRFCLAEKAHIKSLGFWLRLYKVFLRVLRKIHLYKSFSNSIMKSFAHKNADIVISYVGYPGPWDDIATSIRSKYKIAYVHNDPYHLGLNRIDIADYYKPFNSIVCVSDSIRRKMVLLCPDIDNKCHTIYNILNKKEIMSMSIEFNPFENGSKYNFVTVTRLDNKTKRIDRIIEAAQELINKGLTDFSWHIIGDGNDCMYLEKMIAEKELKKYIFLEGFKKNPYPYIKNSDLFVLTSDFEGLPVTLMEARLLMTPMVSTKLDCAKEIIINEKNGILTDFCGKDIADKIFDAVVNKRIEKMKEYMLRNPEKEDDGFLLLINNLYANE